MARPRSQKESFGRLTVDQVQQLIDSKAAYIFDNNSPDRYAQGHVPTAKWVAFDDVKPADLPADKSATLIFYCGGERCIACHKAAEMALELGYKNVNIMPAGIWAGRRRRRSSRSDQASLAARLSTRPAPRDRCG